MKFLRLLTAAAVGTALVSTLALAQTSATQTFNVQVTAINEISMSGAPSLLISSASAGGPPTSVTSATNTWAVTTNQTGSTISGSIASAMPTGLTLSANLGAPAGATSAGLKALGTTAVALVTGVTKVNASGLSLTYQLDATTAAGVVNAATLNVTYTITGGV